MDDLQTAFDRGFEAVKSYVDAEFARVTRASLELVEEVASLERLLHEKPSVERSAPPAPRVIRIERDEDGNLIPVYGDAP